MYVYFVIKCQSSLQMCNININNYYYYHLALSHKDWELPKAQIWLAVMNIDRDLDFPI